MSNDKKAFLIEIDEKIGAEKLFDKDSISKVVSDPIRAGKN